MCSFVVLDRSSAGCIKLINVNFLSILDLKDGSPVSCFIMVQGVMRNAVYFLSADQN